MAFLIIIRKQRYAAKKQVVEGKKKYGFWLTERDAELVKVVAKDDVETGFGKNIKEMVTGLAQHYNCNPSDVLEMAVARMYASQHGGTIRITTSRPRGLKPQWNMWMMEVLLFQADL